MSKEATVKRLATDLLMCSNTKLWIDPTETERIYSAATREHVRELIKEKLVAVLPNKPKPMAEIRKYRLAKAKGRHMGLGKRRGTANARCSKKKLRIKIIRKQRACLKAMRSSCDITKEEFRIYYRQAGGRLFKNTPVMCAHIAKKAAEKQRDQELVAQAEALRISKPGFISNK